MLSAGLCDGKLNAGYSLIFDAAAGSGSADVVEFFAGVLDLTQSPERGQFSDAALAALPTATRT